VRSDYGDRPHTSPRRRNIRQQRVHQRGERVGVVGVEPAGDRRRRTRTPSPSTGQDRIPLVIDTGTRRGPQRSTGPS
jgi:hypothetical protein